MLDYQALKNTALNTAPYDYLVLEKFVEPSYFENVANDFPDIAGAGSFPPSQLQIKGAFKQLMEALDGLDTSFSGDEDVITRRQLLALEELQEPQLQ